MSADADIRSYVDRLVRIETERRELAKDAKAVRDEAKNAGFSPKLIATCVRIMLLEAEKRAEALAGHEELDLYLSAVGLVAPRAADRVEEVSPGADASAQRHARVIPQATDAAQGRATPATARVSDVVRGDVLEEPVLRRSGATVGERPGTNEIRLLVPAGSSAGEPSTLRNAGTGAVGETCASVPATRVMFAVVMAVVLVGCTDDPTARRTAAASGITDVRTTGYAFFGCDKNDAFHTGFVGRGVDGGCVEGVVCSGLLKGGTMRITGPSDACPIKSGTR